MTIAATTSLADLSELITKGTTPTTLGMEFADNGVPFVRVQNLIGGEVCVDADPMFVSPSTHVALKRSIIRPNDVLVAIAGTIGRVAVVAPDAQEMNCNQAVAIVRPSSQLHNRYLLHWLSSREAISQIRMGQVTATISNLSLSQLGGLRIPLPPLDEQQRIAAILDAADSLRAKRRAALAKLDQLAQSIFIEMFGDLVENDRSWPLGNVSDLVAGFESGKNLLAAGDEERPSRLRVLKVSSVSALEFKAEESKPLPFGYEPPYTHLVRQGDLLFSRANTSELVGATALVEEAPRDLVLPDKIWRFVWHHDDAADPYFVWFLFQQRSFRYQIAQRATGTSGSMKNISQQKVLSISIAIPLVREQRRFSEAAQSIMEMKKRQRLALKSSEGLFASLQHRAFRGEL